MCNICTREGKLVTTTAALEVKYNTVSVESMQIFGQLQEHRVCLRSSSSFEEVEKVLHQIWVKVLDGNSCSFF